MLLAMLLVLGLSVNAFAAEDMGGDAETIPVVTEQTETVEDDTLPTEEVIEPEEITGSEEVTEPKETVEAETVPDELEALPDETEAPDDAAAPEDAEAEQPDDPAEVPQEDNADMNGIIFTEPIPGYDPSDPDNQYPFGIPVDNFFPTEFMDSGAPRIMLLAASQGGIPDEMWDNSILRALAYTKYNVQKLKDNNWLYRYEYVSGRLRANAPDVLSNIGYLIYSSKNSSKVSCPRACIDRQYLICSCRSKSRASS